MRVVGLAAAAIAWMPIAALAQPQQIAAMRDAGACVALTFDDGPDANLTPQLLSILESKAVNASFFVIGFKAANLPAIVAREDKDGDDVGQPHLGPSGVAQPQLGRRAARTLPNR
jgi:peptidoglycan/xylan/chitin deacetylase (PgdA/CDA1 family)